MAFEVLSNNLSWMQVSGRLWVRANLESTKQWVDPESINAVIMESGMEVEVSCTQRELESEWADALRQTASIVAQEGITQSSGCVEAGGLLSLFLVVPKWRQLLSCSQQSCGQYHHSTNKDCCQNVFDVLQQKAYHLYPTYRKWRLRM